MLPLGLVLILSALSAQVAGTVRYANVNERVELPCLYSKGDVIVGDAMQWEKDRGVSAAEWELITLFHHVSNPWRDNYVATFDKSAGASLTLSIRATSISQSGAYRCLLKKDDQVIELASFQLVVIGGDVLSIGFLDLSDLPDTAPIPVMTANPRPINFTVVAFNDVKDFIDVQAGEKNLTSGTTCRALVDSSDIATVNTTCSIDISQINQGDDGVRLTITVTLPTYPKPSSISRSLSVLVPPTIECQKIFFAIRGTQTILKCLLRSRGSQVTLAWNLNQKTLISLDSTLLEEHKEGLTAQVNRQDKDASDGAIATLLIQVVGDGSYGVYTLVATNEGGRASADMELKAAEAETAKPDIVKDFSARGGASAISGGTITPWLLAALTVAAAVKPAPNSDASC